MIYRNFVSTVRVQSADSGGQIVPSRSAPVA